MFLGDYCPLKGVGTPIALSVQMLELQKVIHRHLMHMWDDVMLHQVSVNDFAVLTIQ